MPRRNKLPKVQKYTPHIATCGTKHKFANQLSAQRQADMQMLQQPSLELAVYKCNTCKGWHLTSRPRPL